MGLATMQERPAPAARPVLSGLLLDFDLPCVLGLTVDFALLAIGAALWRR